MIYYLKLVFEEDALMYLHFLNVQSQFAFKVQNLHSMFMFDILFHFSLFFLYLLSLYML
jgi:hypothetical protein